MSQDEINVQRAASYLLPDPGGEVVRKLLDKLETAYHERDTLGDAIIKAATKAGICNEDSVLTGPHLVMLCDHLANSACR